MKNIFAILLLTLFPFVGAFAQQGVGIGTNTPAEKLDVIGAIKIGNTNTTNAGTIRWTGTAFEGYDGTQWVVLSGGAGSSNWTVSGTDIYNANIGNVGVGVASPTQKLDVDGAIKLGTTTATSAGSIRWDGSNFQGYDGTQWVNLDNQGGTSPFETTSNVTSNSPGDLAADDFVFGSDQLDDDNNTDHDYRMFFDKSKGAFRAGGVIANYWNDANVGSRSIALGYETKASGDLSVALGAYTQATQVYSTALGSGSTASGNTATAMGKSTTASQQYATAMGKSTLAAGAQSTAMGNGTIARSSTETAIGSFNTDDNAPSWGWWDPASRIFVVGNGTATNARSNALTIYKNGTMNINDAYNMPTADGTNGQVLMTDGAGAASWQSISGLGGPTGPTGPAGVDGNDGADGAIGPQGPAGADGNDGADGAVGPQGPAGADGNDGADGAVGPQGPAGADGSDGADGAVGPQGPAGADGNDGADGAVGPQGPAGADGNDGADGAVGPQGPAGTDGNDGADGAVGPQGPAGADGNDGADGAVGPQGPAGADGNDGADGAVGPQGPTGPLVAGTTSQTMYYNGTDWTATSNLTNTGTNIGIGTSAPSATVDIEGTMQFVDGNEGANKVLTSDANGNATWQTPSTGSSLEDADTDTKIQVEESADEDIIRFDLAGTEQWVMQGARLESMNSGKSVLLEKVQDPVMT